MKKSLFKKFYITFLAIMLVGFTLLSVIVLAFSGNYWMGQNKKMLANQVQTIVDQVQNGSLLYRGEWLYQYVRQVSSVVCQATDCQILVVDDRGMPQVVVGDAFTFKPVSSAYLNPYDWEEDSQNTDLGGALKEDCLVVGEPYAVDEQTAGVVYAVIPLGEMSGYVRDLLTLLFLATLLIAVLLLAASYFMASALVRPLTQMSQAARCLARGDFSNRIKSDRKDEIGQLAEAFNDMTLSLEAGEKMRRGFIANVSHELKTPMTTIAGFVDGVLDGTIPQEQHGQYLQIVSGEVKRLSRLVNTLLNLSKLESGEVTLHPVAMDLTQTVCGISFLFEPTVNQKQLAWEGLEQLPELWVKGDADLLHQVFYNLIDNSVKYTPPGGTVSFRGWLQDGKVHLAVRNTGNGVNEKHLPFLFDRFYKVDQSRGEDKNSLGLGLYLVKTIVAYHYGNITVRSIEGEFCEFEVVLPAYHKEGEESNGLE